MIIRTGTDGAVALDDVDNFRAFSVAAACDADLLASALATAGRLDTGGHAWISRDWLVENGRPHDPEWRASLDAMLAYAKDHGWIDEATDSIRAHVEYIPNER